MLLRILRMSCCGAVIIASLPAWAVAHTSSKELQLLVNDAAKQLQISYRHDFTESHARHEHIRHAITAWKISTRSDADNQLLALWLRQVIRSSMPGSHEPLPPIPEFDRHETHPTSASPTADVPQEAVTPMESSSTTDSQNEDPFRDDPGQDKPLVSTNSAKK